MPDPLPHQPSKPEPAPEPPDPTYVGRSTVIFLIPALLVAAGYLYWMTALEGKRVLVVVGLLVLMASFAGLAHWMMDRARRK